MSVKRDRCLLLANPHSGTGKALSILNKRIAPRLDQLAIDYDIIVTKHANHAAESVAHCVDLQQYQSIIIIAGDGLIFEVINGMLERKDRRQCLAEVPLGIVPLGSGNGLLASVFSHLNKPDANSRQVVESSIEAVCNRESSAYPVNLLHVETPRHSFGAFLSVGYGLLADIDIESERWRKSLGRGRFVFGMVLQCLLGVRVYRCRLSFLNSDHASCSANEVPPFRVFDERTTSLLPEWESSTDEFLRRSHVAGAVPRIDEPLPGQWSVVEDDFVFIYAVALSHVATNAAYMPEARLNDTNIYLTYALKKDVHSRGQLMRLFSELSKGHTQFGKRSVVKTVRVRSLRIEPLTQRSHSGRMVVDGEVIDCDKLQVTVSSSTISVIGG